MKKLYVVRHAKSSWSDPLLDDFDRPLNKRGRADAPKMGKRLGGKKVKPDLIISSPAERAWSTCLIIADKLGYPAKDIKSDRRLYHASDQAILDVLREIPNEIKEAMIFGHNPGMTDFVNSLSPVPVTDNIPTCGVVAFDIDIQDWKNIDWKDGLIDFVDFPKNKS